MNITLQADFNPLNNLEMIYIKKLHKQYPCDHFYLDGKEYFDTINSKLIKHLPYCDISHIKQDVLISLHQFDLELNFENMPEYPSLAQKMIMNDLLLLKEMLSLNLSEKRFKHSLSVAETCKSLAECHHVSSFKAYRIGLLHDLLKEKDISELDAYLKYYDSAKLSAPDAIKHGYAAKYYLMNKCNFHQREELNAIYHHSDGHCHCKLALILFIADKREPNRGINDGIIKLANNNLYQAYKLLLDDVHAYLEKKNERIV